ncbi:hypothetical protein GALMADRAFT_128759 [Galerina marginata CBS 339.88]|uniref:Chromatin modification-related protein n=1 Tax=Galerina marginata (strain CBS 339.88) TaxID=685588 RepID=A0A067SNJ2_GALM3|nr:hypothetical protein GALMADRAFT_128759 [Galerina marginata CBS 339.88]
MNAPVPNLEEAANVATEFIYSVDNLPSEVSYILQEIKHLDARAQDLQLEIDRDSAKYIRHSRRVSSASVTPPSPSSRAPSPKSVSIPAKIHASYTEIQDLAGEKCVLAERLIEIITRTRARLEVDLTRMRTLQGDPPEVIAASVAAASKPLVGLPTLSADNFGLPGRNPALAISESLRNALTITPLAEPRTLSVQIPVATSPSPSAGQATKKRRVTTTTSIKITPATTPTKHRSASPTIAALAIPHVQQKSRLSRQVLPMEDLDQDMDAEGEEEGEMEEDNEDETPYCICQKPSYGDMIACDNEGGCPYEWFHLACVGLKQPTPEKWYCSTCIKDKAVVASAPRKGRKK